MDIESYRMNMFQNNQQKPAVKKNNILTYPQLRKNFQWCGPAIFPSPFRPFLFAPQAPLFQCSCTAKNNVTYEAMFNVTCTIKLYRGKLNGIQQSTCLDQKQNNQAQSKCLLTKTNTYSILIFKISQAYQPANSCSSTLFQTSEMFY